MVNETKAEMAQRHKAELGDLLARFDHETQRLNRKIGELEGMLSVSRDTNSDARADRERYRTMLDYARRERNAMQTERDVLRGFIMREIPLKIAELPAPIATALGVYTATEPVL